MTSGRVLLSQGPSNNQCTGLRAWKAMAFKRSHQHLDKSNVILIPVPFHQVGKYLKRQYKRALRVDYNAGALDRWKSNWYKSLCWSWIILFSLVVIRQDIPLTNLNFSKSGGEHPYVHNMCFCNHVAVHCSHPQHPCCQHYFTRQSTAGQKTCWATE